MRSAARRNERSNYKLDIQVSALADATAPVQADFADGLQGGPDFWEVTGLRRGDTLNMRRGPSASEGIVLRFANGAVLRNKGCRMNGGQRWCKVERPDAPAISGWVAGRFLRESSYQGATSLPAEPSMDAKGDALVPGTKFHATGQVPCARTGNQPMGSCAFGVVRGVRGDGTLTVFWPDGSSRIIEFKGGAPVRSDQPQPDGTAAIDMRRNADLMQITIGQERFEIVDAIIQGG
jgi:hypothetical protein